MGEKFMSKQCLSIKQTQHLQELGVDMSKASMCWCTFNGDTALSVHDEYCYESASLHPIPTFTLQDILDLLPAKHEGAYLTITKRINPTLWDMKMKMEVLLLYL